MLQEYHFQKNTIHFSSQCHPLHTIFIHFKSHCLLTSNHFQPLQVNLLTIYNHLKPFPTASNHTVNYKQTNKQFLPFFYPRQVILYCQPLPNISNHFKSHCYLLKPIPTFPATSNHSVKYFQPPLTISNHFKSNCLQRPTFFFFFIHFKSRCQPFPTT